VPFLKELIDDDEEILIALAKSLYDIVKFVGNNEVIKAVLPIYESFFSYEDNSVRSLALNYIEILLGDYNNKDEELYNIAKRLGASENYAARMSAIAIYCKMCSSFSSSKYKEIITLATAGSTSEIPIVRKNTAIYIRYLIANCPKLESECLSILKVLMKDELDLNRVFAVESLLFKTYESKFFMSTVWPILKPSFEDASWRVKYGVVTCIGEICASAGKENVKKLVLPYYTKYLVDSEYE